MSELCACAHEVLSLDNLFDYILEPRSDYDKTVRLSNLRKEVYLRKVEEAERICGTSLDLLREKVVTAVDYRSTVYIRHAKEILEKSIMSCATPV